MGLQHQKQFEQENLSLFRECFKYQAKLQIRMSHSPCEEAALDIPFLHQFPCPFDDLFYLGQDIISSTFSKWNISLIH